MREVPHDLKTKVQNQHESIFLEQTDSIDWVERRRVSPVKNQGACKASHSFAAAAALESAVAIKRNGGFNSASVQHLIDCDILSAGCFGGDWPFYPLDLGKTGFFAEGDYSYP